MIKKIRKINKTFVMLLLLELAVFPLSSVLSAEADKYSDEEAERELIKSLEKMNSIVSETKMNADYVPGTVTVLYGSDLESRGIRTVAEAMTLVPGVELNTESTGIWQTLVRGVNRTFSYGNFTILLNGFPLIKAFWINPLPGMPIEQVERIEIIRGPGSAIIYGEFAMSGAVNIITRKQGADFGKNNRVFAGLESNDTYKGGGVFSLFPNEDLHLSLNIAGMNTKGPEMETGPDLVLPDMGLTSYAPDFSNENTDYGSGFFTLKYKDTFMQAHIIQHGQGDFFRFGLPDSDDIIFRTGLRGLDVNHVTDIDISSFFYGYLQADFRMGWQEQELKADRIYFFAYGNRPDIQIFDFHYKDRLFHGGVNLKWSECPVTERTYPCHKVLFAWSFAGTRLGDIWYRTAADSQPVKGDSIGFSEGEERVINSLTLQDEFHIAERFILTAGLRYDHYNDTEDIFSPQLAMVYHLDRKYRHLLKAQYARSFRPPTIDELQGNNPVVRGYSDIGPETADSFEVSYVYRGRKNRTVARINVFYYYIEDMIDTENNVRKNCGSASLKGAELEFGRQVTQDLNLDANISYTNTEIHTGQEFVESANWLANIGLVYRLRGNAEVAVQYRHVGSRHRESEDPRGDLKGYDTVNITGSLFDLGLYGLTIRAGIKNLFDEDVRYPSFLTFDSNGDPIPTYSEDIRRPGREWWMQLSYGF
ncbi:MAG: TonB-dependent receptor [Desulfobacteraceae bacterium]|nr:TonB-dependent receptor [Desulfobacteraceae bacterium]